MFQGPNHPDARYTGHIKWCGDAGTRPRTRLDLPFRKESRRLTCKSQVLYHIMPSIVLLITTLRLLC